MKKIGLPANFSAAGQHGGALPARKGASRRRSGPKRAQKSVRPAAGAVRNGHKKNVRPAAGTVRNGHKKNAPAAAGGNSRARRGAYL